MEYGDFQNSLYQNAAMGITALKQVIPEVKNTELKHILIRQYNNYKRQTEITASQMKAKKLTPSFPPLSSRLMAKAGISVRMKKDSSTENIAKMLIKGTNTGIISLTGELNHTKCDSPEAVQSAKNYLRREQRYIESLKPFL